MKKIGIAVFSLLIQTNCQSFTHPEKEPAMQELDCLCMLLAEKSQNIENVTQFFEAIIKLVILERKLAQIQQRLDNLSHSVNEKPFFDYVTEIQKELSLYKQMGEQDYVPDFLKRGILELVQIAKQALNEKVVAHKQIREIMVYEQTLTNLLAQINQQLNSSLSEQEFTCRIASMRNAWEKFKAYCGTMAVPDKKKLEQKAQRAVELAIVKKVTEWNMKHVLAHKRYEFQ